MKKIWILLVLVGMFFVCNAGAVNVITKVTNPEKGSGKADGIQPGGDRENSYSWCMDIFHQEDGDYLYVGSNRDVLYLMLTAANSEGLCNTVFDGDISMPSTMPPDLKGRIFRWKITDTPGNWECVYKSPSLLPNIPAYAQYQWIPRDLGYRGAITFSNETGTDTAFYIVSTSFPVQRVDPTKQMPIITCVLKFPYNFDPKNEDIEKKTPKEVLRIVSQSSEAYTLRPIAKYNKKLYVGTSNNEIYESASPQVQPDATWPPTTSTNGWNLVATDDDFNAKQYKYFCWQFQEYAGYLYVVLGSVEPDDAHLSHGFLMYRGKYNPDSSKANTYGWVWENIIGDTGPYPPGMGNKYHGVACMSVFQNYLYLGTSNDILGPLVNAQSPEGIIYSLHPPKIFRFDKDNNCNMIIGDTKPDSQYEFLKTRLGNYGSGFYNITVAQRFFPEPFNTFNFSMNQYIWWMETYNNKLYCSTFDLRSFLKYIDDDALQTFGMEDAEERQQILNAIEQLKQVNKNPAGFDIYVTSDGINWSPLTTDGFEDEFNYGGRVMKSTGDTMYVGTANPFYGAQVWSVTEKNISGGGGGGGACFIATAAFGSPLANQVYILRQFRDRYLLTNTPGRNFVKWYYKNGPIAANFITGHPATKIVVRMFLYPLVFISYLLVSNMFWYFVLFICSSLLLFIMLKKKRENLCV